MCVHTHSLALEVISSRNKAVNRVRTPSSSAELEIPSRVHGVDCGGLIPDRDCDWTGSHLRVWYGWR